MGIHLWYANELERLGDILMHLIRDERPVGSAADIFKPIRIVITHPLLENWLRLGVARRAGIAANLHIEGLLDFLESILPDERRCQRLDSDSLTFLLLGLLADTATLSHPDLAPLQSYLAGDDTGDRGFTGQSDALRIREDAQLKRRLHLARHLAELMDGYHFDRQEMLETWRFGGFFLPPAHQELETWQRQLFLTIEARLAEMREDRGRRLVSLPHLVRSVPVHELELPETVHIFGLSYISQAFRDIFTGLSTRCALHLYTLNPCMEFWEDVDTRWQHAELRERFRERSLLREEDEGREAGEPFELDVRGDTPALRLWGRPGRENIRLLNALTDCDFSSFFFDPTEHAPTLLNHLKRDILFREAERDASRHLALPPDDSIRVLRCPSIQREVEVVASHIWERIRSDETLRFDDIAIVVSDPQADAYLARIQAVFTEAYDIPHVLLDVDLGRTSRFVEAADRLLELPFSEFDRESLLTLLCHPNIVANFGDVEITLWQQWCDALGIVHGADRDDHADTYIERDLFHWDQGLKRIALGLFMGEHDDGPMPPVPLAEHPYVPLPLPTDQRGDAARLILLVRSLIADVRFAQRSRLPLADWLAFMAGLLTAYLETPHVDDRRARHAYLTAIEEARDLDLDSRPVPYRVALELLKPLLARLRTHRGQPLTDGVLVAPVSAMRPLPFRVVFVLGLGEGLFPTAQPTSPLDLRAHRRRAGDVTDRQRDAWFFLETLVQTREQLTLSYVWRDTRTGEELSPAAPVQELLSMLKRGYVEEASALVERHPLRRHDPRYFIKPEDGEAPRLPNHIPEAHREALAESLRRHLERHQPKGARLPTSARALARIMDPDTHRALMRRLAMPPLPEENAARFAHGDAVDVHMGALRHFLKSPLQGSARVLGMRQSAYADIFAREDEHFEAPFFAAGDLLMDVWRELLRDANAPLDDDAVRDRYAARAELEELSGHYPTGVFAEAQAERDRAILDAWRTQFTGLGLDRYRPYHRVRFGQTSRPEHVELRYPPITIPVTLPRSEADGGGTLTLNVRLHGTTGLLGPNHDLGVGAISADDPQTKHLLSPFLDHVLLSAAGLTDAHNPFLAIVLPGSRHKSAQRLTLEPLSAEAARAWLTTLLEDLFGRRHDYLLPIEAVLKARGRVPPRPVADEIQRLVANAWSSYSSQFGPIRRLDQLAPPPDADAVAERRLGLLLKQLRS